MRVWTLSDTEHSITTFSGEVETVESIYTMLQLALTIFHPMK